MKNQSIDSAETVNIITHVRKIMRVSLFFLFFFTLASHATISFGQKINMTLNMKSVSIKQVCQEIEKQSDYVFVFSDECEPYIRKQIGVNMDSNDITEILNTVFANSRLLYKMLDKQIVVYEDRVNASNLQ